MRVKLPKSLLDLFRDPEEVENEETKEPLEDSEQYKEERDMLDEGAELGGVVIEKEAETDIQLDVNWNICKYLPEAGSCQDWFSPNFHRNG